MSLDAKSIRGPSGGGKKCMKLYVLAFVIFFHQFFSFNLKTKKYR